MRTKMRIRSCTTAPGRARRFEGRFVRHLEAADEFHHEHPLRRPFAVHAGTTTVVVGEQRARDRRVGFGQEVELEADVGWSSSSRQQRERWDRRTVDAAGPPQVGEVRAHDVRDVGY
jgi:hypothetical protein